MIAQNELGHMEKIAVERYGELFPRIDYIVAHSHRGLVWSGHAVFNDGATVKLKGLTRPVLRVLGWKEVEVTNRRGVDKTAVYREAGA